MFEKVSLFFVLSAVLLIVVLLSRVYIFPTDMNIAIDAVKDNDLERLSSVIEKIDVNSHFYGGIDPQRDSTLLHIAAMSSEPEVVAFLLAHGADPTIQDYVGRTPLHDAIWNRQQIKAIEIVKLLGSNTKTLNIKSFDDATPLRLCNVFDEIEIGNLLLSLGANANQLDRIGRTELHLSAINRQWGFAKMLINNGADPKIKDYDDKTPLDYLSEMGFSKDEISMVLGVPYEQLVEGVQHPVYNDH